MRNTTVSIVIPAYGQPKLLEENLPILLKVLKGDKVDFETIVVDDASPESLTISFPEITILRHKKNQGFAAACNTGARASKHPFLCILNTDVVVTPHFLEPLFAHFEDENAFAVSPKIIILEQNNFNEAITSAKLKGSNLIFQTASNQSIDHPLEIFYACGAACLIDKRKFFELGGFDEIFSPFYLEDSDLSYRAWKHGYKVIYEPKSLVYHHHSKTIRNIYKEFHIQAISFRNRYFFRWKNFTDPLLVFFMILELFTLKLINPNPCEWVGFIMALKKLKAVLARRKEARKLARLTDKQVFAKFK